MEEHALAVAKLGKADSTVRQLLLNLREAVAVIEAFPSPMARICTVSCRTHLAFMLVLAGGLGALPVDWISLIAASSSAALSCWPSLL